MDGRVVCELLYEGRTRWFDGERGEFGEAAVDVLELCVDGVWLWSAPPAGEARDSGERGAQGGQREGVRLVDVDVGVVHWLGGVFDGDIERADVEANRLELDEDVEEPVGVDGECKRGWRGREPGLALGWSSRPWLGCLCEVLLVVSDERSDPPQTDVARLDLHGGRGRGPVTRDPSRLVPSPHHEDHRQDPPAESVPGVSTAVVRACTHSTQIDADGSDTIADIKTKIEQAQGHPTATQKIIYSGMPPRFIHPSLTSPLQERCCPTTSPSNHARSRKRTFWFSWSQR